jgi:hypothetical protein
MDRHGHVARRGGDGCAVSADNMMSEEHNKIYRIRLEALRAEIAVGTEQLERGEYTVYASGKELADRIKAEGRKARKSVMPQKPTN